MVPNHPTADRAWTIRSVPAEVRQLAKQAAKKEGMTLSNWVSRTLHQASLSSLEGRSFRHGAQPAAVTEQQLEKLDKRMERMEWILLPLSALMQRHSLKSGAGDSAFSELFQGMNAKRLDG